MPRKPTTPGDPKAHGKRVPHAQKLAMKAMLATGASITEAAAAAHVSRDTAYRVRDDKDVEILPPSTVDAIKRSLIGGAYETAFRARQAITDAKLEQASALQLATVFGITIEKGRLMEEKSTANVSHRGVLESIASTEEAVRKRLEALGESASNEAA